MIIFVSQIIVLLLGVTIFVLSGWGILAPDKLITLVTSTMDRRWGIYIAVIVRLVLGAALIGAAPSTSFPIAFQVLGWIAIVAAAVLVVVGRERLHKFIVWWSEQFSASLIRLWLLFGLAFGAFLVYGVL